MKMTRRVFGAVLALIMMLSLAGCGGMTTDDAKAMYSQFWTPATKRIFQSTQSRQTPRKKRHSSCLTITWIILCPWELTDAGLSDELSANYRQLFQDMLAQAKYELGEATEGEDGGFVVEVSAEPFTAFDGLQDEVLSAVQAEMSNITDISQMPSDEEINEMVFQKMYDSLVQRVAEPSYGEAQTVELHVELNDDNMYYINEDDLTSLDSILFPADNL